MHFQGHQEKIVAQKVIRRPSSGGSKGPSPPSTRSATPPDTDMEPSARIPSPPAGDAPPGSPAASKLSYRRTSRSFKAATPPEDDGPVPKIQPWDLVREHVARDAKQSLKKARGVSANKKFLKNYNLERFGLFDEH